jgi:predicted phosphohydrolase
MALYVISDTHLSFLSDKPMGIFGARWQDHHVKLKERWEAVVNDGDTVVVPGDISWAMTLEEAKQDLLFLESLPGKKIISKGNHEYWWSTVSKIEKFFNENNIETIDLLHNNAYVYEGCAICGTRGWYSESNNPGNAEDYKKIVAREVGRLKRSLDSVSDFSGERLVFLHFPPVFEGFVCREIIDLLHEYNVKRCYFGHIHGKYNIEKRFDFEGVEMRLISADFLNFIPYRIN